MRPCGLRPRFFSRFPRDYTVKKALTNLAVLCVTVLGMCILSEGILRSFVHRLPLEYQAYLQSPLKVLAQGSKVGPLPRDYVLVLGDSYAQGAGDWMLSADKWKNPSFNTQSVLHEITGGDFLSFGQGGAGSLDSLAVLPEVYRRFFTSTPMYKLDPPKKIIAFFYEGNDLADNIRSIDSWYRPQYDESRMGESDYFSGFVEDRVRSSAKFRWWNRWLFTEFIFNLTQKILGKVKTGGQPDRSSPNDHIEIRLNGQIHVIRHQMDAVIADLPATRVREALSLFQSSLRDLMTRNPQVEVTVVYIPAALSIYDVVSEKVSVFTIKSRGAVLDFRNVRAASDNVRRSVREIVLSEKADFIDPTEELRTVASVEMIHGPRDWLHFNEKGYRTISRILASRI